MRVLKALAVFTTVIAGLGVAFRAKPLVKKSAKHAISTLGLDGVLYVSVRDRNKPENACEFGDPWNAHTLEWSTSSPPVNARPGIPPTNMGRGSPPSCGGKSVYQVAGRPSGGCAQGANLPERDQKGELDQKNQASGPSDKTLTQIHNRKQKPG